MQIIYNFLYPKTIKNHDLKWVLKTLFGALCGFRVSIYTKIFQFALWVL